MTAPKSESVLLERALSLICNEWGMSRAKALAWLNSDEDDQRWTFGYENEQPPLSNAWMQVTRRSQVTDSRPVCPKCHSSAQVWPNQETGLLTCHMVGCHGAGGLELPIA